jgi:hypothetical protein
MTASKRALMHGGAQTPLNVAATLGNPAGGNQDGAGWFGPLSPMEPSAPPEVAGRAWDMPSGWNLGYQPRQNQAIGYQQLRNLANGYDLLRLVIETRKDQMEALSWKIAPADPKVKLTGALKDTAAAITKFLKRPDKEHAWGPWLRGVLDEVLVTDALSIFVRRSYNGDIYALEQIDGALVKRVLDDWARTPIVPEPAYQHVLKGLPAVDYMAYSEQSRDIWSLDQSQELIYRPRNYRAHEPYGYSPVEQILMTVNIALRRQMFQLSYYTEGNIPESLIGVPEGWTADQIKEFQMWWDELLVGDLAERRRARFVPGGVAKGYQPTKTDEIFGRAEEWLARVVCFAFSLSPQPFVQQQNRSTAETAKDAATEEGLVPLKAFIKDIIDQIIDVEFEGAVGDLAFVWDDEAKLDEKTERELIREEVDSGLRSVNSGRIALGEDPDPDPSLDIPMMKTATGYVPVGLQAQLDFTEQKAMANKKLMDAGVIPNPADAANDPGDAPPGKGKDGASAGGPKAVGGDRGKGEAGAGKPASPELKKSASIDPLAGSPLTETRPAARRYRKVMEAEWTQGLQDIGDHVANRVMKVMRTAGLEKAESLGADIEDMLAAIEVGDFEGLMAILQADGEAFAEDTMNRALAQVGIADTDKLFDQVNELAVKFTQQHAADLVTEITESTRNMLRGTIEEGLAQNLGMNAMADAIQTAYAFSPERALLIAKTEVAFANSHAALVSYQEAQADGVDVKKEWLVGSEPCNRCLENQAAGPIPLDKAFPSGDLATPGHPRCECATSPVVGESDDEAQTGGADDDQEA